MSETHFSPDKNVLYTTLRASFDEAPDKLSKDGANEVIAGSMFFENPDFIAFENVPRKKGKKRPIVRWATPSADPLESLGRIKDFVVANRGFDDGKASVSLVNDKSNEADDFFQSRWTRILGGGVIQLFGDGEDILRLIHDNPNRVARFSFSNEDLQLWWGSAWPKTFHDIPTHEVALAQKREGGLGRHAAAQCINLTGYDSLIANLDTALDAIGEHIPTLKS